MTDISRRKLFTPGEAAHPLTPLKLAALEWVGRLGFLTTPQVARLAGWTLKSARGHLRDLFDLGLVERTAVPRACLAPHGDPDPKLLYGSAPTIYFASKDGLALLKRLDRITEAEAAYKPKLGPTHTLFLAHELAVRDVRCWLEEVKRAECHEGTQWWKQGAAAELSAGVRDGKPRAYAPDAVFKYLIGNSKLVGLVEVDRGSERGQGRWQEKARLYEALFTDPAAEEAKGRVIVWTPDDRRRDAVAKTVQDGISAKAAERFWITQTLPKTFREPVWRVPGRTALAPFAE